MILQLNAPYTPVYGLRSVRGPVEQGVFILRDVCYIICKLVQQRIELLLR